jgi:hypothetical protein
MKRFLTGAIVATVLGVLGAAPAAAQGSVDNTSFGGSAAEFLLLGAGPRGAALGGAYAALADDVEALYWNPAGLALMERPGVTVASYSYLADTRYSWGGVAFPMSGGQRAIGLQIGTFGFSDQPIYTLENPEGDGSTYGVAQTFVGMTYSQNFSDRFSAGITGKFISDRLGAASGTGFAVDFGTNFHAQVGPRPIRASFVIQNLGSTLKHEGSGLDVSVLRPPPTGQDGLPQEGQPAIYKTKDWGLPVMFRLGLAFDMVNVSASRVSVLGEFTQPNNTKAAWSGGLEWALNMGGSGFGLMARGSYTYQADNDLKATDTGAGFVSTLNGAGSDGLALGGGLAYRRPGDGFGLSIDYAYRSLGILGATHFYGATVNW